MVLDQYILAFHIAGIAQAVVKGPHIVGEHIRRGEADQTDHRQRALLRLPGERPSRCAPEPRDEISPSHPRSLALIGGSLSRGWLQGNGVAVGVAGPAPRGLTRCRTCLPLADASPGTRRATDSAIVADTVGESHGGSLVDQMAT